MLNRASPATRERPPPPRRSRSRVAPSSGTPAAVERGLAVARGEWIALVNDDCLVSPDALAELLAAGEQLPAIGSVAASISLRRPSGHGQLGGNRARSARDRARAPTLGQPAESVERVWVEVFGASGTLGLYRRAMLEEVGGFDATFSPTSKTPISPGARGWPAGVPARPPRDRGPPPLRHPRPGRPRSTSSSAATACGCSRRTRRAPASRCARPDRCLRPALRRLRALTAPDAGAASPAGCRASLEWQRLPRGGTCRPRRAQLSAAPGAARRACPQPRPTARGVRGHALVAAMRLGLRAAPPPDRRSTYPTAAHRRRSWHEHIPFAFFAVAALRPATIVELGTWKGDSYCAFCQAVPRSS